MLIYKNLKENRGDDQITVELDFESSVLLLANCCSAGHRCGKVKFFSRRFLSDSSSVILPGEFRLEILEVEKNID